MTDALSEHDRFTQQCTEAMHKKKSMLKQRNSLVWSSVVQEGAALHTQLNTPPLLPAGSAEADRNAGVRLGGEEPLYWPSFCLDTAVPWVRVIH